MSITALIPARKGSKGIPNKNILSYKGEPLIVHSIRHALSSNLIDNVFVSTDCPQIAAIARDHGAFAEYLRPVDLSLDETLDYPVFDFHIQYLQSLSMPLPKVFVHLRPTAPDRPLNLIDSCITKLINTHTASAIRTVNLINQHPYRMYHKSAGDFLVPFVQSSSTTPWPYELRRQDLPDLYFYNCCVDAVFTHTLINERSLTGSKLLAFVMDALPKDIDHYNDLL